MLAMLLTLFAGGSLLVAAIGQYAVVAFEGRRRVRESGLRIALGASAEQVMRAVLRESFKLTAIGLAIGFILSMAVGAIMARFLYGITPTDPLTYIGVFTLLATASLVACYLPARRAARVDPLVALRQDRRFLSGASTGGPAPAAGAAAPRCDPTGGSCSSCRRRSSAAWSRPCLSHPGSRRARTEFRRRH